MVYKYDVVSLVTTDYQCGEIPAELKNKTFSSFQKAADAICKATETRKPHCVTVRRMEGDHLMGFRAVTPDGEGDYSYQRDWAYEY